MTTSDKSEQDQALEAAQERTDADSSTGRKPHAGDEWRTGPGSATSSENGHTDETKAENETQSGNNATSKSESEQKGGPEFKVVIEDEAVTDTETDEDDPLAGLETDTDEVEIPVPSGYPVLELRHVSLRSREKGSIAMVLDDVSLAFRIRRTHLVRAGSPERVEALMALLSGLAAPTEGTVLFRGTDLRQIEAWDYRGHQLGVIFAHDALRRDLSAIENLAYTMDASGRTFLKPKDTLAREILEEMNFPERLEQRPVRELSRLDYMRAALARAVSCEPDVLLAQEPMFGLDQTEADTIRGLLRKCARRHDCAVVMLCTDGDAPEAYDQVLTLE
ncbi:ATP-binding cassette domain-containing protein [Bifidobacterium xylocopae]|nr:ATP-binding cassette domain-containing protein [Bifidobacterium xylocopae]